jgi:hypothetical protein
MRLGLVEGTIRVSEISSMSIIKDLKSGGVIMG